MASRTTTLLCTCDDCVYLTAVCVVYVVCSCECFVLSLCCCVLMNRWFMLGGHSCSSVVALWDGALYPIGPRLRVRCRWCRTGRAWCTDSTASAADRKTEEHELNNVCKPRDAKNPKGEIAVTPAEQADRVLTHGVYGSCIIWASNVYHMTVFERSPWDSSQIDQSVADRLITHLLWLLPSTVYKGWM